MQCHQQAQTSAAAHMDCCSHAVAMSSTKHKEEIQELGQLLGYSTVQARAIGVVKVRAESRVLMAKAKGRQA